MLMLSQSFLEAMTKLPSARLKRIPKFIEMLSANPAAPSLNRERVRGTAFFSARVDRDYRGILGEHPKGLALLYVDKHDDAYRWAHGRDSDTGRAERYAYDASAQLIEAQRLGAHRTDSHLHAEPATQPANQPLSVGSIHSWSELEARFRWDADKKGHYLRERDGGIVCACLRSDMNPNAPWEILVGKKPENVRQAKLLEQSTKPIPVFVKEAVDQWEYWGDFRFDHCETEESEILPRLPESRRLDTSLIVFLRDADTGSG